MRTVHPWFSYSVSWGGLRPTINPGIPPVICDEDLSRRCIQALKDALGGERVTTLTGSLMGGDDFALYARKVPAAMIRLGCEDEERKLPLHSSGFRFDEKVLDFGVAILSYMLFLLTDQPG